VRSFLLYLEGISTQIVKVSTVKCLDGDQFYYKLLALVKPFQCLVDRPAKCIHRILTWISEQLISDFICFHSNVWLFPLSLLSV